MDSGDLITIREAEDLVGHSRTWIKARVEVFTVGGIDKVSREAVLAAKREFDTPRPKKIGGN